MKRFYTTYFDRNYLVKGLALIYSLNEHEQNDFVLIIICLDEITRTILKKINFSFVYLIPLHEIEKDDKDLLIARQNRSQVEYYWTLTPTIILRILEHNPHIQAISYLDADLFFSSPDPIWDTLGNYSVLIHEHRFSSEFKSIIDYIYTFYVWHTPFFPKNRGC